MAIEIEAKMKVDDHEPVRARLSELGAERVGDFLEVNTFFDNDSHALRAADQGLRLRQNRDLAKNTEAFVLTFKGPRQVGQVKTRREVELPVGSGRDAVELLGCLGFQPTLAFEKRRQRWRLDDCSVELDEMPRLGSFVEIEGPDEQRVLEVREKLGLTPRPLIDASYIAMLAEHLAEHGETESEIRF